MFSPNTVLRKSASGAAEIANRSIGLRAELRRLLILVDGKTPVANLAMFMRSSDVPGLLQELAAGGLVELASGTPPPPTITGGANNPQGGGKEPSAEQFAAARTAAVRFLNDRLGPSAETLAIKIERAKNPAELREAVNTVRQSLERLVDASAGQAFLEVVRNAATKL